MAYRNISPVDVVIPPPKEDVKDMRLVIKNYKGKIMTLKLKNMVNTLKMFCEFKIVEDKNEKLIIEYEQYNLLYCLKENDDAFVVAMMIIDDIEISNLIESCNRELTLFSGGDILALKTAIEADEHYLWDKYFYRKDRSLKSTNKQYVLDYIEFIKRIAN